MKIAQVREFQPGSEVVEDVATLQGLEAIFNNIVSVVLGLVGIVLFIMLITGGFQYLTSGGDPKKMEGARKTLTFAILGLVLIALSFLFLRFIGNITGVDISEFRVTQ